MKVTIKNWQAVAVWRWDLSTPANPYDSNADQQRNHQTHADDNDPEDEDDEDDEVCGICRLAFDSTCPDCRVPGDDCPLIWGACTHVFHLHCLIKWIDTESSKGQCPMDRRPWVNAERNAAPSSPMPGGSSPSIITSSIPPAPSSPSRPQTFDHHHHQPPHHPATPFHEDLPPSSPPSLA